MYQPFSLAPNTRSVVAGTGADGVAAESDRRGLLKSLMTWAIPAGLLAIRVFRHADMVVSIGILRWQIAFLTL